MWNAAANSTGPRSNSKTTTICSESLRKWWRAWAAEWMNPRRWWMPDCPTDRVSIRRFGNSLLHGEDLVKKMALTDGMLELLKACVRARLNIVISGGTGSGKTTQLNVLYSYIPESERIVTSEDAAELRLRQTHVARLETRPANIEGNG